MVGGQWAVVLCAVLAAGPGPRAGRAHGLEVCQAQSTTPPFTHVCMYTVCSCVLVLPSWMSRSCVCVGHDLGRLPAPGSPTHMAGSAAPPV